jgi:hypothetical protein
MISRSTNALPEEDFEPPQHIMHTQPHPSSISLPTNPSIPIHQHPPPILPPQNDIDPTIYLQPNPILGDPLQEDKPTNTTRLYFANVNGLNLTGDGGDLTDICNQMKTIEADIICLAETHLDTLYRPTNNILRQSLQKNYKDIHF